MKIAFEKALHNGRGGRRRNRKEKLKINLTSGASGLGKTKDASKSLMSGG